MRSIDRDCLDYSDRDFKIVLDMIADEQVRNRLKLHRAYAKYTLANYVEYQRRKGTLHYEP